jgi:PAS domain S-box-containing protein
VDSSENLLLFVVGAAAAAPIIWSVMRVGAAEHRAHLETARARDRLNDALEGSSLAVFDWEVSTGTVVLSPGWSAMLGGRPEERRLTVQQLESYVHPEDVDRVRIAVNDVLRGGSARYDLEHRVRKDDGTWLWVQSRGKVTARDESGRALRFIGTNSDITARRNAEWRLAERESQLRQVIDAIPATITFVSTDERILFHNRQYADFMRLPSDRIAGRTVLELVGEEDYRLIGPYLKRSLRGELVRFEQEARGAANAPIDLEVVYTPLFDTAGRVTGAIAMRFDITRLKELDRMKNRLVAVVSHELRTPLTAMRGSLGLLQGGVAGELSGEATALVDMALANCERLVRLVNDLLDLEKMAAGQVSYRVEPLEIDSVIAQAIASSKGLVASYGVHFEHRTSSLRVRGDSDRLIQVLANLLFNAAKFSHRDSTVTVSAGLQGADRVRTSVRDRGPGIPEHFRSRVFERFAQAEMGDARPREGTGLGLAISREIVEHLGGEIGFHPADGGGTVFWFDLPRVPTN